MPDEPTVLVIEDDKQIRRFLRALLSSQGYRVIDAESGKAGLLEATSRPPEVIILDLGLPDIDGLDVLREIRQWSRVPVVVLSARGQENQKVEALDAGADDYLTKPFGASELAARLRVALRHAASRGGLADEARFSAGDLHVDFAARRVMVGEREVHLTPIEYRLLAILVKHAGKVLTHTHILKDIWGPDCVFENHYLRVYMSQLRRKIEPDPARPRYLLTEPGIGYRLAAE
jgi:two-component system KDP operon response regulator KdpE